MTTTALTPKARQSALDAMSAPEGVDVLVIGGGVTGAGIALDAQTRGLTTAIVEAQDWASGTSSRSSKLVHGGLRYLLMMDFKLVHEALTERDRLLSTIAPHLVRPVPFLYPLTHRVWERPYVTAGIGLYDLLAHAPGRKRTLPAQRHFSKTGLAKAFPGLKPEAAIGAVRYFDAQVDDARLTLTLVRTAVKHGALAASRTEVTSLTRDQRGIVTGAVVVDLETGQERTIKAKHVIAATGVWTEQIEALSGSDGGLQVLASKGIHLVVPRDKIDGTMGVITQTGNSVLFIIPWDNHWIIGTTDTPWWHDTLTHPVADAADIDYLLGHANAVLAKPIQRSDVTGVYAGLRPLLQAGVKENTTTAKFSREHTVASPAPGLTVIAGGKLTTYRVMAKDAVDFALAGPTPAPACVTAELPLLGAEKYGATLNRAAGLAKKYGWDKTMTRHLLGRYGSMISQITDLIDQNPALGQMLDGQTSYLKAEVVYAATHEGALHLEDIMMNRTRLNQEAADGGIDLAEAVAQLAAPHLGWDTATMKAEVAAYARLAEAEHGATLQTSEMAAAEVRLRADDRVPLLAMH